MKMHPLLMIKALKKKGLVPVYAYPSEEEIVSIYKEYMQQEEEK
jgi:hypothetical protein